MGVKNEIQKGTRNSAEEEKEENKRELETETAGKLKEVEVKDKKDKDKKSKEVKDKKSKKAKNKDGKTVERHVMREYPKIVEKAAKAYADNPAEAADILTTYCTAVQDKCIEDARWIFDDIIWHMMKTTKTNHYRIDFQNLENHPQPQPSYVVPLDAAKYDSGETVTR